MSERTKGLCKNYNKIVCCEFLDDDLFSKKLIEYYKKAVIDTKEDEESIKKAFKYDKAMNRYINDYNFSKKLRNSVDISSILNCQTDISEAVLEYIYKFSEEYIEDETVIVNTRWI